MSGLEEFGAIDAKKLPKCKLARELYFVHGISYEQLPTWVCIAEHESKFETDKRGEGYGLFQIKSDWCNIAPYSFDKPCGVTCEFLLDDQLADDVRCAQTIYNQTKFSTWESHEFCYSYRNEIAECFDEPDYQNQRSLSAKAKAISPCALATEMKRINVPKEDISSYVCIALHESRLVTNSLLRFSSTYARLGIFHTVTSHGWCGADGKCNLPCDKLLDTDVEDDIRCAMVKKNEVGFGNWTLYRNHCSEEVRSKILLNCNYDRHVRPCFSLLSNRFGETNEEDCD